MEKIDDKMPYSYHTFMYPFYWTDGESIPIDQNIWERNAFQGTMHTGSDDELLTYATWQYFSPKARRLIFDWEEGAVRCYRLAGINTESSFLNLWLDGNIDSPVYHRLRVNQIRLELLNNLKIGVLIIEAENYGEVTDEKRESSRYILSGCSQEQRLNEITKINDLGRRVFSPFLIKENGTLQKGGEAPWKIILKDRTKDRTLVDCTNIGEEIEQTPDGFEELILGSEQSSVELHPAIDDRMFVTCCLGVSHFSAFCPVPGGKYEYQCNRHSAEMMYKLLFLERDDPTCQNQEMIQQKLREHLDPRWIQSGTIHGVTEYSMLCITGCDESGHLASGLKGYIINPFLTEYVEMAKIAVLQRAAIIQLEDEASGVSREMGSSSDNIDSIRELWKRYLLFQSELILPEVTFQEQGVEMYDILKKSFRISELSTSLNTNMYNLHEMAEFEDAAIRREHDKADSESDNRLARAVNLFAVMGISLTLAGLIQDAMAYTDISSIKNHPAGTGIGIAVLILELFLLYQLNKKWLKNLNRNKENGDSESDNKNDSELKVYYEANKGIWTYTILIVVIVIFLQSLLLLL